MSYTRNFGFRGFENIVRNGRFRTAAASSHVIGAPVTIDPDNAGLMKACGAAAAPTASSGVVVYEHLLPVDIKHVPENLSTVPGGAYAQIVRGPGTKVWFKNNAEKELYDGSTVPAAGLLAASVNVANLKPGDGLTPDGAGKYKVAATGATPDPVWFIIEQANASTGMVEARFTF